MQKTLINVNGFSPHQLVFGQNINLRNVLNDRFSAGVTETKLVGEHIATLHAARDAFIAAESSDKFRRTLRKQTQKTREFYEINDNVCYKRDSDIKWKGPAKVIGQDDPVVFLHHSGFVVKVNCNHLQKTDKTLSDNKYVSNFHKDEKPFCQTNNDTSKSKAEDDQILSEVTKSSSTNIPFDTPIDRLTSNETSNLDKPKNNSNEAENQQIISNETLNVNTQTDNPHETESQLVTYNEKVNESNKNNKTFYKTQSENRAIDPTKLKKGQILSLKLMVMKINLKF